MSLTAGTRLGPYEITGSVGSGGMGEVYRATDTRLGRQVAIKVLPASVAADPDRRARFEDEARAVAALSHPNILAIHDFGVHDGIAYAVMELLQGETLRERMNAGAMPMRKAIDTAIQVARGLAAAHDKGLVHRDLKPENIFLLHDGQVKILDFGLAKTEGAPGAAKDETRAVTEAGTVMGTVGYMAPEQVRAGAMDTRTDLFALGAVLYEMLSGQRAFQRDTPAETMTAILREDLPDLAATRAELPPSLERIVRHCLEKNPAERFQTARDVAFALEALSGSASARTSAVPAPVSDPVPGPRRRTALSLAIGTGLIMATAGALAGWWLHTAPAAPVRKLDLAVDGLDAALGNEPMISPGGHHVVYSANGTLWVRSLAELDGIELPDTNGALYPSWSPDGQSVAFVHEGQLWRVPANGGKPVALGRVPTDMSGSGATCWLADGRILLVGSDATGITSIPDSGGNLANVVTIDKKTETDFHEMMPFPGGVLFTIHHTVSQRADTIEALVNGQRTVVLQLKGETIRQPVYSPTGHLLYQRESMNPGVWAVKFSPASLKTEGEPFLVVPGGSWPSIAADGTLMFVRPSGALPDLVWVDRTGVVGKITTLPHGLAFTGPNRVLSLSPDGKRVLIALQEASVSDLWLYTFDNNAVAQVSHGAGQAVYPLWMPDGMHALFSGVFDGRVWNLHRLTVDSGVVDRLTTSDDFQFAGGVLPDGRTVVLGDFTNTPGVLTMTLEAGRTPAAPVRSNPTKQLGQSSLSLSPDGRMLAYTARQNGRDLVFVRGFPDGTGARLVSTESSATLIGNPMWTRDGKEIAYRSDDSILIATVSNGPAGIVTSEPRRIATLPFRQGYLFTFDLAADGRILTAHTPGRDHIALVLNWPAEVRSLEQR